MLLEARNLTKRFGETLAVDAASFELGAGETLALIGPSGCGKTTLLKLLNRLIEPDAGEVSLHGRKAHEMAAEAWRRQIGYVIQSAGLFPHMSVAENICVTPRLLKWEAGRTDAKMRQLLDMVSLPAEQFAGRAPSELSGGQRQRVALARALAGEPDLLLLDEPFSALDPATKDDLIEDIKRLRAKLDCAIVMVTHDFSEALRLAGRIAVMDAGRIVQLDTPAAIMRAPASPAVEAMLDAPRRTAELVAQAFGGA